MHTSSQPLSPRHAAPLPPLGSPGRPPADASAKRGSPDSPLEDLEGKQLGRATKTARLGEGKRGGGGRAHVNGSYSPERTPEGPRSLGDKGGARQHSDPRQHSDLRQLLEMIM